MSEIFTSSDGGGGGDDDGGEGGSRGGLSIGANVGIAVSATTALILLVLGLLHMSKRRGKKDEGDVRITRQSTAAGGVLRMSVSLCIILLFITLVFTFIRMPKD